MSQIFGNVPPAGYCLKCHQCYAIGPRVCPLETPCKDMPRLRDGPLEEHWPNCLLPIDHTGPCKVSKPPEV